MSQLLCYWEEADRCLNQGEMKIHELIALWANCCWSLVKPQYSIHAICSTNPFSVAFQITLCLGKCCLPTGHPMSCFTSPQGYQRALLLHPVNGVSKWWQIIVLKKFVKKCVLMNLHTLKNYEICRFNKNKKICQWPTYSIRLSHNNYLKTSVKETWMLNVSATQLLKHHVQFFLTFLTCCKSLYH